MRAVNLLPPDEARAQLGGARTALFLGLGGLAAVTVLAGALTFSASRSAADNREKTAAVGAAIAKVPKVPEPAVSQRALAQERSDRVTALAAALATRVAFDRVLLDVSSVLPDDAWLTALTAAGPSSDTGSSAAPQPGQEISIQGATYTHASVARVLSRLAVVPSLADVALESSAVVDPQAAQPGSPAGGGQRVVTFTVEATLRTGGSS